jgi:hypothetical protein
MNATCEVHFAHTFPPPFFSLFCVCVCVCVCVRASSFFIVPTIVVAALYLKTKLTFIVSETPQYQVGVSTVVAVIMGFFMFACLRLYTVNNYRIQGSLWGLLFLTQALLIVSGYILYSVLNHVLMVVLVVFLPPIAFTVNMFSRMRIQTDFDLVQPPQYRNPPFASFCRAFCGCGLPFEDFKLVFLNLALVVLLMGMGGVLAWVLPQSQWWIAIGVPVYIIVLMFTFQPAVKYFFTLQMDAFDWVQLCVAMSLHAGAIAALFYYLQSVNLLTVTNESLLFGAAGLYPLLALFITACFKLYDDRGELTPFVSNVFKLFAAMIVGLLVAVIYFYPWQIGAAILCGITFIATAAWIITRWVKQNYIFDWMLTCLAGVMGVICILVGVGVGLSGYPFEGFTAAYFTMVAAFAVWSFGLHQQGAFSSSGAPNPTPLLYSNCVFPVYRFDVLSNDISEANLPVLLVYITLLLTMLWSIVTAVVFPNIGLCLSALSLAACFAFTRRAMTVRASLFTEVVQYIKFSNLESAKRMSTELQLASNTVIVHDARLDDPDMQDMNYQTVKAREKEKNDQHHLTELYPEDDLHIDYSDIEYLVKEMEEMDRQKDAFYTLETKFMAHVVFLLVLNTRAAIAGDETDFGNFCRWIKENKPEDEFDSEWTVREVSFWKKSEKDKYRKLKQRYLEHVAHQHIENEKKRLQEEQQDEMRKERLKHMPAPKSPKEAHDLFMSEWRRCQDEDVSFEDADFPASDASIFDNGVRDLNRPSALHHLPLAGWMRPCEYCDEEPYVVNPATGFDINQLQQGGVGDCYFISGLGVCVFKKDSASVDIVNPDLSGKRAAVRGL